MGEKYAPPGKDETITKITPWLKGFIQKEYGTHANKDDFHDLEQEGYMSLLQLLKHMEGKPNRFNNEEEYYFYVKAVIRHAIRDYMLKFRSRFGISLFKLRRELKDNDERPGQELGDFMHSISEEFAYLSDEQTEDPNEYATRQHRLSLLSRATKNCRDMDVEESKQLLLEVIEEYKRTEPVEAPFEAPLPPKLPPVIQPHRPEGTFVARTPVVGAVRRTPKKCSSRFCTNLLPDPPPVSDRGFPYCSKRCKKEWPPIINRIQSTYGNTPVEVILSISVKLFRSKRRAAEILDISTTTFEKLATRFRIE